MLWFIMKGIAYGFEVVIISFMTFIFIGLVAEKRPDILDKIWRKLYYITEDDE